MQKAAKAKQKEEECLCENDECCHGAEVENEQIWLETKQNKQLQKVAEGQSGKRGEGKGTQAGRRAPL